MTECNDPRCPIHGHLKTRGRTFKGIVKSAQMQKTAIVEIERHHFIKKYKRYEKRFTRLRAHNPTCISAKEGQTVVVQECRPLSKTKNFVVTKVLKEAKHEGS